MDSSLNHVKQLVSYYNKLYNTSFELSNRYHLTPGVDGVCEFKDQQWPCKDQAGVYLILSKDDEVIYVGQALRFGRRFYQYFKDDNGTCVVRSPYWTKDPHALVAIPVKDATKKYERLSLEEYLIENLQPVDNIRGKY